MKYLKMFEELINMSLLANSHKVIKKSYKELISNCQKSMNIPQKDNEYSIYPPFQELAIKLLFHSFEYMINEYSKTMKKFLKKLLNQKELANVDTVLNNEESLGLAGGDFYTVHSNSPYKKDPLYKTVENLSLSQTIEGDDIDSILQIVNNIAFANYYEIGEKLGIKESEVINYYENYLIPFIKKQYKN